jgi:gamma-glutamylcyclotransferase (GGCT)/AIG2-like uncharacterized protein YtfP
MVSSARSEDATDNWLLTTDGDGYKGPFLFVYGTLMRGFREDWQRKVGAEFLGRGTIRGKLYDLGDYPGTRVLGAEPGRRVSGELYRPRDPELALKTLDEYEEFSPLKPHKSLFIRKLVSVTLEDGRKKRAWVYLYNRGIAKARLIPTGRYRDSANCRHSSVVR